MSCISLRKGQNDTVEDVIEEMSSGLSRTACGVSLTAMRLELLLALLKTSPRTNDSKNLLRKNLITLTYHVAAVRINVIKKVNSNCLPHRYGLKWIIFFFSTAILIPVNYHHMRKMASYSLKLEF